MINKTFFIVGIFLIFITVSVVLSGLMISSGKDDINIELPLAIVDSIAVDDNQNIYCGSTFYSRIQVYDRTGTYKRSWHINAGQGEFVVTLSNNNIQVETFRNPRRYYYNLNGKLLKEEKIVESDIENEDINKIRVCDRQGNDYLLKGRLFNPKIGIIESGNFKTIVCTPWYYNLILFPFPCAFWGLLGGLICVYFLFWKRD